MKYAAELFPIILRNLNTPWEEVLSLGMPAHFPAKTKMKASSALSAAHGFYYIKHGWIRISHFPSHHDEQILLYLGAGTVFNEISMLMLVHEYVFMCPDSVDAVFFPQQLVDVEFITRYPLLLQNMLDSQRSKARAYYCQRLALQEDDLFVKVCRALCSMVKFQEENGVTVPQLTKLELSTFLGLHRSSLHKVLVRLQQEGVIGSYSPQRLVVHNLKQLEQYAYIR